ncbi:C-type lectin domain family 17, member A [Erinaceus europaeus]|uniref:C-type lectin domain family 17, member A n=1 Tax=Erinaceus europaeus TaxID=9365 RepID=A0ABM3WPD8_ERIEU|nr:C-type lectin domain family 17, member A [Erinaceus europaeus]
MLVGAMGTFYTNTGRRGLPGIRDEDDDVDDYENMATPYKDLPPKPNSAVPPRPPRAGKKPNNPPLPRKSPQITGRDVPTVTAMFSPQGMNLEPPPFQPPPSTTPVSWLRRKSQGLWRHQEERLIMSLCLLVLAALFLGCISLVVTLMRYQELVEELKTLTLQQVAWRANVTGVQGLAGLRRDLERVRADTNRSLTELRGSLDCGRFTCPEGWLPFQERCYYFSPTTRPWEAARTFCQEHYSHLVIISSAAEQASVPAGRHLRNLEQGLPAILSSDSASGTPAARPPPPPPGPRKTHGHFWIVTA